jgi:hypothetical protein
MKKLLLFIFILGASASLQAQSAYKYYFRNNLHESGLGPDLVSSCSDSFMSENFPAYTLTRPVYRFQHGCGLNFTDVANFIATGSYTIEMYVSLDTVTSYRKMVDFKNLTDDGGLYMLDSSLDFFSVYNTSTPVYPDGKYMLTAMSRNGANQRVRFFANGTFVGSFTDAAGDAVYNVNKMLRFFQDDSTTSMNEQSGGKIAYLAIYNGERDSLALHNDYDSLGMILSTTGVKELSYKSNIQLWPNPASSTLNIASTAAYPYIVTDLTGRSLLSGTLQKGANSINVASLTEGLYFVKLLSNDESGVYKFVKH